MFPEVFYAGVPPQLALRLVGVLVKIFIKTRQTNSRGLAFDLYYRWQGLRYRPLLGYNLTKAEAEAVAMERF